MRKIIHSQQEEDVSIDMTPMLDVVFIMLIFFIVTANFVKETGIDVSRPNAPTATVQEKANILIAIDSDNVIWIDQRAVDIRRLSPLIERMHAATPQSSVVIQADKASTTDGLIKVMDAARAAGVSNIAVGAQNNH